MADAQILVIPVAVMIVSIVAGVTVSNYYEDKLKIDAINRGATAQQLVCAFNPPHELTARIVMCGEGNIQLPKEPEFPEEPECFR